ncbi:hypothetical protein C8R46DRAFT_1050211 [Mycena filopes]|nr:hypothetical protein C8R46DRAFT_1050211 [Mycena filopes]
MGVRAQLANKDSGQASRWGEREEGDEKILMKIYRHLPRRRQSIQPNAYLSQKTRFPDDECAYISMYVSMRSLRTEVKIACGVVLAKGWTPYRYGNGRILYGELRLREGPTRTIPGQFAYFTSSFPPLDHDLQAKVAVRHRKIHSTVDEDRGAAGSGGGGGRGLTEQEHKFGEGHIGMKTVRYEVVEFMKDAMESNRRRCTGVAKGPHVVAVNVLVGAFRERNVLKDTRGAILNQRVYGVLQRVAPINP